MSAAGSPAGAPPAARDTFPRLLRAELTKFRTVRGWVIGLVLAAAVMVGLSLLTGAGSKSESCTVRSVGSGRSSGQPVCTEGGPTYAIGPNGQPVFDDYFFVHKNLVGNTSLTVRVTSLTGLFYETGGNASGPGPTASGVAPWAKAGLMIESNTEQGAPYAAVMVTGAHGVRMQYNYVNDIAGSDASASRSSPVWLRLTRSGSTLTSYESSDGTHWTEVGSTQMALPETVEAGVFVASPQREDLVGASASFYPTLATATFDSLGVEPQSSAGAWHGSNVGGQRSPDATVNGSYSAAGGRLTVSGSGDIGPATGALDMMEVSLIGAFAGLVVMIVVAALFVSSEYRRGLILTTFSATPRRVRVLAAKAIVVGGLTFVTGLAAALLIKPIFDHFWLANHNQLYSVGTLTYLRAVLGTAALLGLVSVLTLAVATMFRRSAGAVTGAIVLIILPFILARAAVLPVGVAQWMLRVTPAAAFAVQQSIPQYAQVATSYVPGRGYFPLDPWAGIAVLCVWTIVALAIAAHLLRVRDA